MTQASPTVHVEVGGVLRLHPWIDREMRHEDAFSAFVSRSALMHWSSSGRMGRAEPQLWGMNDAAVDPAAVPPAPIAWFQVAGEREPPPVVPFLACVGEVLDRFGELGLDWLRVFLPPGAGAYGLGELVSGLNWYELSNPGDRTSIVVTIDGPLELASMDHASRLLAELDRTNTGAFGFGAASAELPIELAPARTALGVEWLPGERGRTTVTATTPEWSLDALAWVVALTAAAQGVVGAAPGPLVVRIGRA